MNSGAPVLVVDPNLTVPLRTAFRNIAVNGISAPFTLTGWIDHSTAANPQLADPVNGSGTFTLGAPTATTYLGVNLLGATEIQSSVTSSSTISTRTFLYNSSDYTNYGVTTSRSTLVFQPYTVPTDIKAGSTGVLARTATGNFIQSYVAASYAVNSLLVDLIETYSYSITGVNRKTTYIVDTTGKVILKSISETTSSLGSVYSSLTYTFVGAPPAIVLPPIKPPAGGGGTPTTIQSRIVGDFLGWYPDRIFQLENGQYWQQTSYDYSYVVQYGPNVTIVKNDNGSFTMSVQGESTKATVQQLY